MVLALLPLNILTLGHAHLGLAHGLPENRRNNTID